MSSSPKAPDPYQTSQAQTQSNQQTAAYNAALNRVSTYTPYGNQVYSQTGNDASGAPQYRSDITLAPEVQQQLSNQMKQDNQLSNLGFSLADKAGQSLGAQVGSGLPGIAYGAGTGNNVQLKGSLDTSGVPTLPNSNDYGAQIKQAQDAVYGKQTAFLDPQWNNSQRDLESKLSNQGIMRGSEAWDRAAGDFSRNKEFSYGQARDSAVTAGNALQNQLFGQGIAANQAGMSNAQAAGNFANQAQQQQFGQSATNAGLNNQGIQQALQQQAYLASLPLNQLNALRSGTQIQNPTFAQVPGASAQPTDVSGNIWNAYNAKVANSNNFMNGLFGLGSAAITAFSDRRLKTEIERVKGYFYKGFPLYAYRYAWSKARHMGVMAQDVIKSRPDAVYRTASGHLVVNYGAL